MSLVDKTGPTDHSVPSAAIPGFPNWEALWSAGLFHAQTVRSRREFQQRP